MWQKGRSIYTSIGVKLCMGLQKSLVKAADAADASAFLASFLCIGLIILGRFNVRQRAVYNHNKKGRPEGQLE
jgi:hypothetical protein